MKLTAPCGLIVHAPRPSTGSALHRFALGAADTSAYSTCSARYQAAGALGRARRSKTTPRAAQASSAVTRSRRAGRGTPALHCTGTYTTIAPLSLMRARLSATRPPRRRVPRYIRGGARARTRTRAIQEQPANVQDALHNSSIKKPQCDSRASTDGATATPTTTPSPIADVLATVDGRSRSPAPLADTVA